jgi:tetratricopeptide (TPR) repeat protein
MRAYYALASFVQQAEEFVRQQILVKVRYAVALIATATLAASHAAGQSVQYRSPAGVEYRSQPDTGAIARAERALAADPRNPQRFVDVAVAQSGVRQFREAIQTLTRGLAVSPNNALLLRWRGHRYLSVRDFDRALADLTRGSRIDSTIYGIWYHLGIVRFERGEFAMAANAFRRAQPIGARRGRARGVDRLVVDVTVARRPRGRGEGDARAASLTRFPIANAYRAASQALSRGDRARTMSSRPPTQRTFKSRRCRLAWGIGIWSAAIRPRRERGLSVL